MTTKPLFFIYIDLLALLGQFRRDVGAVHADGEGVVNGMSNRPELIGVLYYVEFDLEISVRDKPVFICSREKEFVALRLQETIEILSVVTCNVAGERSTIIGESKSGCC